MGRKIIILGAGISGLSLLHYLKKQYKDSNDVDIKLIENNPFAGGTVRSISENGYLFETGPNGFLSNSPLTVDLIRDLGIDGHLITAKEEAKKRFILYEGQLHCLPDSLKNFLSFKLLNIFQKIRILSALFLKSKFDLNTSVYAYGTQKFGEKFADLFIDSFVKGVYGADATDISFKAAFPSVYRMEKLHGTIFKGMLAKRNEAKLDPRTKHKQAAALMSMEQGMGMIVQSLTSCYNELIEYNQEAVEILYRGNQYTVRTIEKNYIADELYICTPAYVTSKLMRKLNPRLAQLLGQIEYSSIGVMGLSYDQSFCANVPKGFGYLIPSVNKSSVLGVLFESNIFKGRAKEGTSYFRCMVDIKHLFGDEESVRKDVLALCQEELKTRFGIDSQPAQIFFKPWKKAIPKYNMDYLNLKEELLNEVQGMPGIYLRANYLGGISLNDCIKNSHDMALGLKE